MTSSGYIIQNHFYDKLINNLQQAVLKMEKEMEEMIIKKTAKN